MLLALFHYRSTNGPNSGITRGERRYRVRIDRRPTSGERDPTIPDRASKSGSALAFFQAEPGNGATRSSRINGRARRSWPEDASPGEFATEIHCFLAPVGAKRTRGGNIAICKPVIAPADREHQESFVAASSESRLHDLCAESLPR